jgi:PKD repeat protein
VINVRNDAKISNIFHVLSKTYKVTSKARYKTMKRKYSENKIVQANIRLFLFTMKILKSVFIAILGLVATGVFAQEDHLNCGERENRVRMFGMYPEAEGIARRADQALETYTENFTDEAPERGSQTIYTIPVVFHVIHNNGPENISDEQILNGLSILNRDYAMLNSDISLVVTAFETITADVGIQFALATKDPNGNCTRGINRVVSTLTSVGDQSMKDLIMWPRNKYLNIWICLDAAGAAGYSNLPPDVAGNWGANTDGIVVRSDYVGSIGTSTSQHSRTLTHETGHWLNLYHTWGPGNSPGVATNCNQDDNVTDTPNTIGWTSCALTGSSCGNTVDNVQNYMEYSYCSRMFTQGQRTRMRAAITSSVASRSSLITASNLLATGVTNPALCVADFEFNKNILCAGDSVTFNDISYHGITSWNWNFGDGVTLVGSDPAVHQNPIHTYDTPGTFTVTLTVSNGADQLSKTYSNVITVLGGAGMTTPLMEGFEGTWPGNNWFVNNPDLDETWQVVTPHYSGANGLKLSNFTSESGHVDEFISNTFDMSAMDTIFVSYKWAYASRVSVTDDRLRVSASGDCGTSWTLARIRKGTTNLPTGTATNTAFTPQTTAQWSGETLTLTNPNYMTDHFQLKYEFISYGGNNLYLDDINITAVDTLGNFIEITESPLEVSLYPNPTNEAATLVLGSAAHKKTSVVLFNSAGEIVDQIYNGNLSVGTHTFSIPKHAAGFYIVQIQSGNSVTHRKLIFE